VLLRRRDLCPFVLLMGLAGPVVLLCCELLSMPAATPALPRTTIAAGE